MFRKQYSQSSASKNDQKNRLYDDNNAKRDLCNEAKNVQSADSERKGKKLARERAAKMWPREREESF
jgi:hypothetical protein